jgi:HD-GYP domain-containing protein (c-di-GMP phosphodiesterase class II)
MELARPVYDGRGTLLLDAGTILDSHHLPVLARLEVRNVLVQDPRVDDVIVVPFMSEETEAQAVRLLHRLLDGNRGSTVERVKLDLVAVDRVVKAMIQGFYSAFMGEIDSEGWLSLGTYDYVHPVKVAGLSLLVGKEVGHNRTDLAALGIATLLQNIGYTLMPQNILVNMEPSAQEGSQEFRKHPQLGHQIVRQQGDADDRIGEAILQHHERWNGSGYPGGLKGKAISPFARIIAIASAYHALVSRRPRQEPYAPPEAAEYIAAYSGEYFDPELVQIFLRSVPFYPKGVMARLSTGETGVVTNTNVGYIGRPVVRICCDRNGVDVAKPYDTDLTQPEQQDKVIVEVLDY